MWLWLATTGLQGLRCGEGGGKKKKKRERERESVRIQPRGSISAREGMETQNTPPPNTHSHTALQCFVADSPLMNPLSHEKKEK